MRPLISIFILGITCLGICLCFRDRRCCRYSNACPSMENCILSDHSIALNCSVSQDSKKDLVPEAEACSKEDYSSPHRLESSAFRLSPYVFNPRPQQIFPALDLHIKYDDPWEQAQFRFTNLDGNSSVRCVKINRSFSEIHASKKFDSIYLSYDCEAGFFIFGDRHLINTAGSIYRIDICLTFPPKRMCGSYLFTMPTIRQAHENPSSMMLIDRDLLLKHYIVSLHAPQKELKLAVFAEKVNSRELIYKYKYSDKKLLSFAHLSPGHYTISSSSTKGHSHIQWTQIAQFSIEDSNSIPYYRVIMIVLAVILFLFVLITCCMSRNLMKCRERYSALPTDPFKKELRANVIIISDVNHPEHSEVLMHLSKYLQVQPGIHKVFFAMDPETGIVTQANHDPWQWAQDVLGNIDSTKDYIVYSASPSSDSCPKLYENLCENQTLLSTKYLSKMAEGNRVCIIDFPYSVPSSISPLVPKDVPSIPHFVIPYQLNEFLKHIQGSSGTNLLSKLSCDVLHNEIDFIDVKGIEESSLLIHGINTLSFKLKKLSLKDEPKGGLPVETLENELLSKVSLFKPNESPQKTKESALELELEKNILSLNDGEMSKRDTSVNVEFA